MKNSKRNVKAYIFIPFVLLLGLAINSFAQVVEFSEAKGVDQSGDITSWNFNIGSDKYEVFNNGEAKKITDKKVVSKFRFPLEKGEEISQRIFFAKFKSDTVFLYEANAGGEGLGYITSFDSTSMKPKWKVIINGFNVGQGLIEGQFAFVTAIGFIGKINLSTGKYVWKHDNLYSWNKNEGAFNFFEIPEIEGGNVIFSEKTDDNSINIIVVNKSTGKIIRTVIGK